MLLNEFLSDLMKSAFVDALGVDPRDFPEIVVTPTANSELGDYQCNSAMAMAKSLKRPPRELAQAAADKVALSECLDRIEVAGPGFINLRIATDWLTKLLETIADDERLGAPLIGAGKTVVMDYGSPNITKPLHIGHLRSHNIGGALDRIYRFLGYKVISDNHLGDWGAQFGITIMGWRHYGDDEAMRTSPLEELERVYVKSYEQSRLDEEWLKNCRNELAKLQAGDPENLALWREFARLSRVDLDKIYDRMGITYDLVRGESYYADKLESTVKLLEEKGLAVKSEGAVVVFLEEEKLPVCIVRKSDGAFNYATTDIATVISRVAEFTPDRIVYVTDERQQLHFRQIFAICARLGYSVRLDHVWFGLMRLPDATFSTREGNVIKLTELLDKAESKALELVRKSSPNMPAGRQAEVARAVGIGAVKYADLSQNPRTVVTFTFEKALALDGNSAPYLQYAYARIASVRDKYAERYPGVDPASYPLRISEPIERALALQLARFPETIARAAHAYMPNVVADYLYELAQTYSAFYQNVPFLKAPEGIRESRVRLCGMVAGALRAGLTLLGIETLERI